MLWIPSRGSQAKFFPSAYTEHKTGYRASKEHAKMHVRWVTQTRAKIDGKQQKPSRNNTLRRREGRVRKEAALSLSRKTGEADPSQLFNPGFRDQGWNVLRWLYWGLMSCSVASGNDHPNPTLQFYPIGSVVFLCTGDALSLVSLITPVYEHGQNIIERVDYTSREMLRLCAVSHASQISVKRISRALPQALGVIKKGIRKAIETIRTSLKAPKKRGKKRREKGKSYEQRPEIRDPN